MPHLELLDRRGVWDPEGSSFVRTSLSRRFTPAASWAGTNGYDRSDEFLCRLHAPAFTKARRIRMILAEADIHPRMHASCRSLANDEYCRRGRAVCRFLQPPRRRPSESRPLRDERACLFGVPWSTPLNATWRVTPGERSPSYRGFLFSGGITRKPASPPAGAFFARQFFFAVAFLPRALGRRRRGSR